MYCFFAASSPDISASGLAYYTNNEGVEAHISYFEDTWIEHPIDIEGGTPDIGYPISPWNCFMHLSHRLYTKYKVYDLSTIPGLLRKIIALIIY